MERAASEFSKLVANEVKAWQKKRGLTQAQLAAKTGMTITTVQRTLGGKSEMDVEQLDLLSRVLNVSPQRLIEDALGEREQMSEVAPHNDDHEANYKRGDLGLAAEQRSEESDSDEDYT